MTRTEIKPAVSAVKELLAQEPDALREIVRSVMQAMLAAAMDEALGAGKRERSAARIGRAACGERVGQQAWVAAGPESLNNNKATAPDAGKRVEVRSQRTE